MEKMQGKIKINSEKFRVALLKELEDRINNNSSYSLRSFAKFLNIDAPSLSKILNRKHVAGYRLSKRLLERLGRNIFDFKIPSNDNFFNKSQTKDEEYFLVKEDEFKFISKWYYYAILELMDLKDFETSPKWIAEKLNISINEAKIALERLVRLNIITINSDGTIIDNSNGKMSTLGTTRTSAAMRNQQKEILEKAIDALENIPVTKRDQSSMTVAINSDDIDDVKNLIKNFRRNLARYLNNKKDKDSVYNLSISFYPVSE